MCTCYLLSRMSLLGKWLLIVSFFFFNISLHPVSSEHLGFGHDYEFSICNLGLSWEIIGCEVSEVSTQEGFTKPLLEQCRMVLLRPTQPSLSPIQQVAELVTLPLLTCPVP